MNENSFDVIVVGGGHAGYEAALAAARIGARTLMVTINRQSIGRLSCNPSVGGIAKSHIVSELDALGGELGRNADYTGIQFRTLNTRKGPAVQANRLQCDTDIFPLRIQAVLGVQPNLEVREDQVTSIIIKNGRLRGIECKMSGIIDSHSVVIATGTFLRGRVLIGMKSMRAGRMGEDSSEELSASFKRLGFELGRLKTGTPPRLHKQSLNYAVMSVQPGEEPPPLFSRQARREWKLLHVEHGDMQNEMRAMSHVGRERLHPWPLGSDQLVCYLTHTNERTYSIIHDNLQKSSMYGGMVEGIGVRYCPSIEDKVVKFQHRDSHHVFVEPEGRRNVLIYPNGTSNSLPEDVQEAMIHSIKGFENASIACPGYAIEYDYSNPTQLSHTLETKRIENLYFAGQLNGTTGYEEAAGQGFVAGTNAALKSTGREPFILGRDEAYIGVLIDDLVTRGTNEPYRMFTSRSEHRLILRQGNVYFRLLDKAKALGIVCDKEIAEITLQLNCVSSEIERLSKIYHQGNSLVQILRRPEMRYRDLPGHNASLDRQVTEEIEVEVKYEGYIKREKERLHSLEGIMGMKIPSCIDYKAISGLRFEACEKLEKIRPATLDQAARISGVNPSDIAILSVTMKKVFNNSCHPFT